MLRSVLFIVILMITKKGICVRLIDLRIPAHAAEGEDALFGCQFDLEGDLLYSVKWYKESREFYRYVPKNKPQMTVFHAPGIDVDLSRSSSNVVALKNLTADSGGVYKCEVSGEAPLFATASDQRYTVMYLLPEHAPLLTGLQAHYKNGDRAIVNCTSSRSNPKAELQWFINDTPVRKEHKKGPWYKVSEERLDGVESTLQLRFKVKAEHYKQGVMKLKCLATIAPLYQQETTHIASRPKPVISSGPTYIHPKEGSSFQGFTINFPFSGNFENDLPELPDEQAKDKGAKKLCLNRLLHIIALLILVFIV